MNFFIISTLSIVLLFDFVNCAKFPDDIERCKNGDGTCLKNIINDVIEKHYGGHRGLNLIPIDPLKIKTMIIAQSPQSPVNVQLKFSDVTMTGFKNTIIKKSEGFDKDPNTTKVDVFAKIPYLTLAGPYEIKGSVLILPITGRGQSNLTLENVDARIRFLGSADIKNGKEFLHVNRVKLEFNISRLHMYFENLFNGEESLGEAMNTFLNENWSEIFNEIRPAIQDAIGEILQVAIQGVFAKIPYSDMFLK